MKLPKHPRLTPLKAFTLLRKLDRKRDIVVDHGPFACALDEVRDALASHIRAALSKAGSR